MQVNTFFYNAIFSSQIIFNTRNITSDGDEAPASLRSERCFRASVCKIISQISWLILLTNHKPRKRWQHNKMINQTQRVNLRIPGPKSTIGATSSSRWRTRTPPGSIPRNWGRAKPRRRTHRAHSKWRFGGWLELARRCQIKHREPEKITIARGRTGTTSSWLRSAGHQSYWTLAGVDLLPACVSERSKAGPSHHDWRISCFGEAHKGRELKAAREFIG
jgi:hypothetical protein